MGLPFTSPHPSTTPFFSAFSIPAPLFPPQLRGILVAGGDGGSAPSRMRAFVNRTDVDFDLAQQLPPAQEWGMVEDPSGSTEYQTRPAKFQGVASLTLHFPGNFGGGGSTRIWCAERRTTQRMWGEPPGVWCSCDHGCRATGCKRVCGAAIAQARLLCSE